MDFYLTVSITEGTIKPESINGFEAVNFARKEVNNPYLTPDLVERSHNENWYCEHIKVPYEMAEKMSFFAKTNVFTCKITPAAARQYFVPEAEIDSNKETGEIKRVKIRAVFDEQRFLQDWLATGCPQVNA